MKYRIYLREVIEPYLQREWSEDYNTEEEAKRRIISVNAGNHFMRSSDYYIQAKEQIDEVQD